MKKLNQILFISVLALVGCETAEDRKVSEAQTCLDNAKTGSDATTCISKVDGLETAAASRIRCGGTYIQRDFTAATFTTAFDKIKNNTGNGDAVLNMMVNLRFSGASSETGRSASSDAAYVFSECDKSLSPGLKLLGSATYLGTDVSTNFASCTTPATMANCISGSTSDTVLGTVAVSLSSSYCTGSAAESDVCKQIKSATASGGSTDQIGAALRALLNTSGI